MRVLLNSITVEGYKSIRKLENFPLSNLNILVGANGAGKSVFLEIFDLLQGLTVPRGLADLANSIRPDCFFGGSKTTETIAIQTRFGDVGHRLELQASAGRPFVEEKALRFLSDGESEWNVLSSVRRQSLFERANDRRNNDSFQRVAESIGSWRSYSFHNAVAQKKTFGRRSFARLKTLDKRADYLASFLYYLKTERFESYREIVRAVRLAAPFFDDFVLSSSPSDYVLFGWRQKGLSETLSPGRFSDGAFRFACLATALLQPELPAALVIDSPETGLHPATFGLLAELIQGAARQAQVVIATQSAELLDAFKPEDVVAVNRKEGASTFERLVVSDLNVWLEDCTLGELWRRNVIVTTPTYEG